MPLADTRARGLSPLARGTLNPLGKLQYFSRFIPAGAGNTMLSQ
ncbi:hypothetical protein SEENIN0B_03038 [Salmonella enterica subsp. enterica serovar Infantis str. SARB27]|uniref:Uncharacterized protein n=1 Tax=Salmonella enterica subsp. enterica serovar Infantis str. SARB27 TaxID=596155 RepID=A0A6C8GC58_SALIN|nr:hypothetical protein SEENIN0B_03038 [Salmonella enterica subsp. enterica serovar Infantis str. SARB27]